MSTFASFDGTELFYEDEGDGFPVILLHGFAADTNLNYVRSGILDRLLGEGYRVIALDARGHGLSAKPHDPAAYADDAAEKDVQALLDETGVDACAVVGYSMGAGTSLRLAGREPRIVLCVVLGVGETMLGTDARADRRQSMLDAFRTDDPESLPDYAKAFRTMADAIHADRDALAAVLTADEPSTAAVITDISQPVLVITGVDDVHAGAPEPLAEQMPNAASARVPGDHFTSPSQPSLHDALVEFLATAPRA
jgi:pimeloyl-ACP methyl ester carboxylesterase